MPVHHSIGGETCSVVKKPSDQEAALDRLRRELARGTAELAVLSVLKNGRSYGYELLKKLQQLGGGDWEIKEGTLYPLLHRLENAGHIVGDWETEGRARPCKYYHLTDAGRTHATLLRREWNALIVSVRGILEKLDHEES